MNSRIFYLFALTTFAVSCRENPKKPQEKTLSQKVDTIAEKTIHPENSNQDHSSSLKQYFHDYKIYTLNDTIIADLNGDQIPEKAYFNRNNNLIIKDGKTHQESKMNNAFDDDFGWVEYWATTNDKKTFEITIVNEELGDEIETALDHTSIIVRKEGIGGVISFKNGEYKWIHQAD